MGLDSDYDFIRNVYYPISEKFISFQGEGNSIGSIALFIRIQGCNYRCNFCDTFYSRDEGKENEKISAEDIIGIVNDEKINRIIFTGGEPFFKNGSNLVKLIYILLKDRRYVEVETNGSIDIYDFMKEYRFEFLKGLSFNISPKLFNTGNFISYEMINKVYNNIDIMLDKLSDKCNFSIKFVVRCNSIKNFKKDICDINEVFKSIYTYNTLNNINFYLMPMSSSRRDVIHGTKFLLENRKYYDSHIFKISSRLQYLIYGNKKGV